MLLVLALFGCGPIWILVCRSELFNPLSKPSPLDVCLVRAQRCITLMAGFYFVQAIMLFPPEFFASSTFSYASYLSRDMAALKHIMHACFFFAGYKHFIQAGNVHPLEICRGIFLLTLFPSCVAAVYSSINFWNNGIVSIVLLSWAGAGLALSCVCVTSHALYLIYKDEKSCQSKSHAVTSIFGRYQRAFLRLPKDGRETRAHSLITSARGLLWLHVVILGLSNLKWLFHLRPGETVITLNVFGIAYVRAMSMALHWGFVLGNGMHGINFCSLSSLELYIWGSFLLLASSLLDIHYPSTSSELRFNLFAILHWLQFFAHFAGLSQCLRLYLLLKNEYNFNSRSDYTLLHNCSAYKSTFRGTETRSFWSVARSGLHGKGHRKSFRYYFFGHLLAVLSSCCVLVMVFEAASTPWYLHSRNSTFGQSELISRTVDGMNFSLHAMAIYYFAFYRSVRGLTNGGSAKWGALGFFLLGFVSFSQSFSLLLVHPVPRASGTIIYNIFRTILYVATVVAYVMFPSHEFVEALTQDIPLKSLGHPTKE